MCTHHITVYGVDSEIIAFLRELNNFCRFTPSETFTVPWPEKKIEYQAKLTFSQPISRHEIMEIVRRHNHIEVLVNEY